MTPAEVRAAAQAAGGINPLARQLGVPRATVWAWSVGYSSARVPRRPGAQLPRRAQERLKPAVSGRTIRAKPERLRQPRRPYMVVFAVPKSARYKQGFKSSGWQSPDVSIEDLMTEENITEEDIEQIYLERSE